MAQCTTCESENRNECRCDQDCVDCGYTVNLEQDCEWPEHDVRCWSCLDERVQKLEAGSVAKAESGMLDAASEWTKSWRIIAQALKELRCPDCDGNARVIIARLAAENMLIVGVDNVKD